MVAVNHLVAEEDYADDFEYWQVLGFRNIGIAPEIANTLERVRLNHKEIPLKPSEYHGKLLYGDVKSFISAGILPDTININMPWFIKEEYLYGLSSLWFEDPSQTLIRLPIEDENSASANTHSNVPKETIDDFYWLKTIFPDCLSNLRPYDRDSYVRASLETRSLTKQRVLFWKKIGAESLDEILDLYAEFPKVRQEEVYEYKIKIHGPNGFMNLKRVNCTPAIANQYSKDLCSHEIAFYYELGLSPEDLLNREKTSFSPKIKLDRNSTLKSISGKINYTIASLEDFFEKEIFELSGQDIRILEKLHLSLDYWRNRPDSVIKNYSPKSVIRSGVTKFIRSGVFRRKNISGLDGATLIGYGTQGLVLYHRGGTFKISRRLENEYAALEKLMHYNGNNPQNVIKLSGHCLYDSVNRREGKRYKNMGIIGIPIEHIEGNSLDSYIKGHTLTVEEKLKIAKGILNGLVEIRRAGLYHRDVHPRNILIERNTERPIIIDFGYTTNNPSLIHEKNNRYGGNNDLVSAGQVIYELFSNHTLFLKSENKKSIFLEPCDIKKEREKTYSDPTLKESMLDEVKNSLPKKIGCAVAHLLSGELFTQPNIEEVWLAKAKFEGSL